MAAPTNTRDTRASLAACRIISACRPSHRAGSGRPVVASTTLGCRSPSRRARGNRGASIRYQMSTSSPPWWLTCPNDMGPPRACAKSPTIMIPRPFAATARPRSPTKDTSAGCPKSRCRAGSTAWYPAPSSGSATAPWMHAAPDPPITRASPAVGAGTVDQSSDVAGDAACPRCDRSITPTPTTSSTTSQRAQPLHIGSGPDCSWRVVQIHAHRSRRRPETVALVMPSRIWKLSQDRRPSQGVCEWRAPRAQRVRRHIDDVGPYRLGRRSERRHHAGTGRAAAQP
jgi:hypothetical protein